MKDKNSMPRVYPVVQGVGFEPTKAYAMRT